MVPTSAIAQARFVSPKATDPAMPLFLKMTKSSQASPLHMGLLHLPDFFARPVKSSVVPIQTAYLMPQTPRNRGRQTGSFIPQVCIQLPCRDFHHLALEDLGPASHGRYHHKHQPANNQPPFPSKWQSTEKQLQ